MPISFIRPIIPSIDVADISELIAQLGHPTNHETMIKRLQYLRQSPNHFGFVAIKDGAAIGFIGCLKTHTWEFDAPFLQVQVLVVDSRFRRQNIGKMLMNYAEAFAQNNGMNMVQVNSSNRPERIPAHHFYQNYGFRPYSTAFRKQLGFKEEDRLSLR